MAKFKVKITQVFRTERVIVVDVESEDLEGAIDEIESGNTDAPDFDDPNWKTGWDLQSEEVEAG